MHFVENALQSKQFQSLNDAFSVMFLLRNYVFDLTSKFQSDLINLNSFFNVIIHYKLV